MSESDSCEVPILITSKLLKDKCLVSYFFTIPFPSRGSTWMAFVRSSKVTHKALRATKRLCKCLKVEWLVVNYFLNILLLCRYQQKRINVDGFRDVFRSPS